VPSEFLEAHQTALLMRSTLLHCAERFGRNTLQAARKTQLHVSRSPVRDFEYDWRGRPYIYGRRKPRDMSVRFRIHQPSGDAVVRGDNFRGCGEARLSITPTRARSVAVAAVPRSESSACTDCRRIH